MHNTDYKNTCEFDTLKDRRGMRKTYNKINDLL